MSPRSGFSWVSLDAPESVTDARIRAGVDRVEMADFRRTLAVAGEGFLARVFTPAERAFSQNRVERLAVRFAAKEAVAKILGTGFRGIGPRDIEVLTAPHGAPSLRLHGAAGRLATELGIASIAVSLTHTATCTEAFVVALADGSDLGGRLQEVKA